MRIETARLYLKEYTMSDLSNFYKLKSNPTVWTYSTFEHLKSIDTAKVQLIDLLKKQSDHVFHALFLKEADVFIGEAGIIAYNPTANRCTIGYNLLPEFWSKGYATEISKELVRHAFESLVVERVEALAMKKNVASCRVLGKSGLKLEGTLRHFTKINDKYEDVCYFAAISSDI